MNISLVIRFWSSNKTWCQSKMCYFLFLLPWHEIGNYCITLICLAAPTKTDNLGRKMNETHYHQPALTRWGRNSATRNKLPPLRRTDYTVRAKTILFNHPELPTVSWRSTVWPWHSSATLDGHWRFPTSRPARLPRGRPLAKPFPAFSRDHGRHISCI